MSYIPLQHLHISYFIEGLSIGNQMMNGEYSWVQKRTKNIDARNEKAIFAKEVIGWLVNWFIITNDENGNHDITVFKNSRSIPCGICEHFWGQCLTFVCYLPKTSYCCKMNILTYAGSKDVPWEKDEWLLFLVALHSGHKPAKWKEVLLNCESDSVEKVQRNGKILNSSILK